MMKRLFRSIVVILIGILMIIPAAAVNMKYGMVNAENTEGETEEPSEDVTDTVHIEEFKICPVLDDGTADFDNPLVTMPESYTFTMGTEYAFVFTFADFTSQEAHANLLKVIEDSGILTILTGAASPGGASVYVKGAAVGSATLELSDNYTFNACVEESEEITDTVHIEEFKICPVLDDGTADFDNPLVTMPESYTFTMGTEYALVFTFADFTSQEAHANLLKVIEDSGILTILTGAASPGGASIYVKGTTVGSATLELSDNYTFNAYVEGSPASWKSNSRGWWYDRGDGTYPADEFEVIDNQTYYFDSNGYMVTGWRMIDGYYYFFNSSGAMKTNAWEGDYYLLADGRMAKSQWIGDKYYVGADGKWIPAHWESTSKGWWYNFGDGSYPANRFETIGNQKYYFDASGYMVTGWKMIDGYYYFFQSSGAMKTNAWEGNYYLLNDGRMAVNQWVDNNRYYVGSDGKWIKDYGVPHWESNSKGWWYNEDGYGQYPASEFRTINGAIYYFDASGYMVTGWKMIDGYYYFFQSSGAMKTSAWEGNYYLNADGRMATSCWIGHYYVDANGKCIDYPYVASKNSEVFHKFNCPEAAKINASNLIHFKNYESAASGRRPCHVCEP